MQKSKFLRVALLSAAVFLSACGGQAVAAPLSTSFVASDGQVFSTAGAVRVKRVGANITIFRLGPDGQDGGALSQESFQDTVGAVWAKFQAIPDFASKWVAVPGQPATFHNTELPVKTRCIGSTTLVNYAIGQWGFQESYGDGCQLWQAVKAISN